MIFVAIAEHSPAQCPGSNQEVLKTVQESMPRIPELEKKHNVKNLGIHVMIGAHKAVIILDAPSFEAAEMVLLESRLISWNTVELAQTHTPDEAIQLVTG
ncbi:MAG: hypothetical protein ACE5JL_14830 [Dehalococcoidia bacterium]